MRKLILFILLYPFLLHAQNTHTLKGKILQSNDSLPLAYAHIGIPKLGIGTVSNNDGKFSLHVKCSTNDTIQVSYLGFQKLELTISNFNNDSIFYLTNAPIDLMQVNIISNSALKEIVNKAIENIPKNYSNNLYYSKGFYRETQNSKNTNRYTRLLEVAFNVQDKGIKHTPDKIRLNIDQIRKSNMFSEATFFSEFLSKLFSEKKNNLYGALATNPIRNYHTSKINKQDNLFISIEKDTTTALDLFSTYNNGNSIIYEIDFCTHTDWNVIKGKLIINKSDYSILKLNAVYYNRFKKNQEIKEYTIEYKKFDKRYYPIYIIYKHITDIRHDNDQLTNGISTSKLIFTDFYFNRKEFNKIKSKFSLKDNDDIYDYEKNYDPDFWKNYNILIEEPINPKVIDDLTKKDKLSDQFKNNSKN